VSSNSDVVFCNFSIRDFRTGNQRKRFGKVSYSISDSSTFSMRCFAENPFNKIYRFDYIKRCELKFSSMDYANDQLFALKSLYSSADIECVDQILVIHNVNQGSVIRGKKASNPLLWIEVIIGFREFLQENNLFVKYYSDYQWWCIRNSIAEIEKQKSKDVYIPKSRIRELFADFGLVEISERVFDNLEERFRIYFNDLFTNGN
jgi:hypothetical protein